MIETTSASRKNLPGASPDRKPLVGMATARRDQPSIMVVDDNDVLRQQLARSFEKRGYFVQTASNCDEALVLARSDSPEMAVIDLRMPGQTGLELLQELKKIDPTTRILVLTGFGSIATAVDAMRLGACSYLAKPADADDVLLAFARAEKPSAEFQAASIETPSLARAEWEHIHRVLSDCEGNLSEAARRLGIHRRSLQRKLRKCAP